MNSILSAGISKQLKGLWVSVELGQPYFIKRLGMCNLALPLLWVGGREKKKKEWASSAETSPTEEKGSSGQDIHAGRLNIQPAQKQPLPTGSFPFSC